MIQSIVFTTEIVVTDKGKPQSGKSSFGVAVSNNGRNNGRGMFIDFLDKYFLTLNLRAPSTTFSSGHLCSREGRFILQKDT